MNTRSSPLNIAGLLPLPGREVARNRSGLQYWGARGGAGPQSCDSDPTAQITSQAGQTEPLTSPAAAQRGSGENK